MNNTTTLTPAEALDTLKRISVERYEQDGGTTYECLSDAELAELLEQNNNNPEEAWDFRVRIYQAQREVCAAYDNDPPTPAPSSRFKKMFSIPASYRVLFHWAAQDEAVLESIATKIEAHDAEPWVWAADERHYEQFAGPRDRACMESFTQEEVKALVGHWE